MKNYLLSPLVGIACGLASAVFLASLDWITHTREANMWLILLLPLGGLLVSGLYDRYGRRIEGGNGLILDEFHDPKDVIPLRMAPLVLIGTLLTHLFGGSAGREGTAVQMGASIADQFTHIFKLNRHERRVLLMAGMSGGFGSVFGVPFAGMIFGLEVLSIGRLNLWAALECAIASFVAHYVTLSLGIHHTSYPHIVAVPWSTLGLLSILIAGLTFGLAARLFARTTDRVKAVLKTRIAFPPFRTALGGVLLSMIYLLFPICERYAGLGVPHIVEALNVPVALYDWFGKLAFTALTLGTGFKGGEVTPLLFVGATLGNALSGFLALPLPMLAATGLVAVFSGAANTPLACTFMAMELFGAEVGLYAFLACVTSFAVSGRRGIYHGQVVFMSSEKWHRRVTGYFRSSWRRPE